MKKVPRIPLRLRDGDWFRKDGRPSRLVIGLSGTYLECGLTGRRDEVDALRLATLIACGRLVAHDPRLPLRRSRDGGPGKKR